jgi:hypothetical protein
MDSPYASRTANQRLRKLRDAAEADGSLRGAAQRNTELMLSNLLRAVGFKRIDVPFAAPAS